MVKSFVDVTSSDGFWYSVGQDVMNGAYSSVLRRLNPVQHRRAPKTLGTRTTNKTLQRALDLVTEKGMHDRILNAMAMWIGLMRSTTTTTEPRIIQ